MTTPFAPGVTTFANIQQGFAWDQTLVLADADGDPYNLAGWTVRAEGRQRMDAAEGVSFTATVTGAATGEVALSLDFSDSAEMASGRWTVDLVVDMDDGAGERVWVRGSLVVEIPAARPAGA